MVLTLGVPAPRTRVANYKPSTEYGDIQTSLTRLIPMLLARETTRKWVE